MGRMTGQTEVQSRKDLKTTLAQFVNDLGKCKKKTQPSNHYSLYRSLHNIRIETKQKTKTSMS